MQASITYPRKGDAKGRFRQVYQLSIRCKETVARPRCGIPGRRVMVYVIQGSGEEGPQVTICPDFFNKSIPNRPKTITELAKGPKKSSISDLMSYGHIMLHEFMHVQKFGHCEKIVDLNSTLQSCNGAVCDVYGASRCDEFAHIYGKGKVNTKATVNADNYAWWATGMYWAKKYGWAPSKRSLDKRQSTQFTIDDSANPNLGIVYDDAADDPSFSADASTFNLPPSTDQSMCHMDMGTAGQPKMICDGQDFTLYDPATEPTLTDGPIATSTSSSAQGPGSTSTAPPPPPPVPPAYAPGVCSFHIDEYATCEDEAKNLYANVKMWDNGGSTTNPIGETDLSTAANKNYGNHIDVGNSYSFTSKLKTPLIITGEHANDYVQFTLGAISWKSTDKGLQVAGGVADCNQGGWDPRSRSCIGQAGVTQKQGIDCSFPCPAGT